MLLPVGIYQRLDKISTYGKKTFWAEDKVNYSWLKYFIWFLPLSYNTLSNVKTVVTSIKHYNKNNASQTLNCEDEKKRKSQERTQRQLS